jgi:hypothetical protein
MSRIKISNLNSKTSVLTDLSATETTNIVGGSSGKKGYGDCGYENEGRGNYGNYGNYGYKNEGHGNYGNYGYGYGHGYGHGGDYD